MTGYNVITYLGTIQGQTFDSTKPNFAGPKGGFLISYMYRCCYHLSSWAWSYLITFTQYYKHANPDSPAWMQKRIQGSQESRRRPAGCRRRGLARLITRNQQIPLRPRTTSEQCTR